MGNRICLALNDQKLPFSYLSNAIVVSCKFYVTLTFFFMAKYYIYKNFKIHQKLYCFY